MQFPGKEALPKLGVGLSFRTEIADSIYEHAGQIDFAELIVDNELNGYLDCLFWEKIAGLLPLSAHAINTSLGSLEPIDLEYVKRVQSVGQRMRCAWFSEHLAFTHSEEVDAAQLLPLQFSERNAAFVSHKIDTLNEHLEFPLLIENSAAYFAIPGSHLTEVEFLLRVLELARCGLLLDINNLYANSINFAFDPYKYLDQLPAAVVVEIHVAGGERRGGLYIDTHGHAVNAEVMNLVDYAVRTKRPNAILLEREKNFPPMDELMGELRELKRLWVRHLG
jgi:uncharacterized protein (UPF0276 family)